MEIPKGVLNRIFSEIDGDEIAQLALDLAKIRGPSGYEEEVGEYVYKWMEKNDLNPVKQLVAGCRFNVIGKITGAGRGKNLAFNSHLDTAPIFTGEAQADKENYSIYNSWAEGDRLYGLGIMNCRGPMSVWLSMAKAIKKSNLKLEGDLVLTAVIGEIGLAPVDEYQGPQYIGKGIGTEYAVKFGPAVDYAVVSETTDFGVTWAECGIVYLRIMTRGVQIYSPRLKEYKDIKEHPNAILKMVKVIGRIENWARDYETKSVYEFPGGIIKPKVNIGAIRGGFPPGPSETPNTCSIFVSIRLLPGKGPLEVINEIKELIGETGIDVEISSYLFKRGYVGENVDPLVRAIDESYQELCNTTLPKVSSEVTSMWRDLNIYNEVGIPAVTFGPARYVDQRISNKDGSIKYLTKDDLVKTAKLYTMITLKICSWLE